MSAIPVHACAHQVPRLKTYDGAYHMLLQEPCRDEVMNDVQAFIIQICDETGQPMPGPRVSRERASRG